MSLKMRSFRPVLLVGLACCARRPGAQDSGATTIDDRLYTCENGVFECPPDLGCHEELCGECYSPYECTDMDGCRSDHSCGACSDDSECQDGRTCSSGVCLPDAIQNWTLSINASDFDAMLADPSSDTMRACSLEVEGLSYGACEVRFRGGSTRDMPKKSFRIEMDKDADGGWVSPGYARKIDLRAEYNDPSFLRTFLGLEVARRVTPLPTPRARFMELTLALTGEGAPQETHYGLMLEVERMADNLLENSGRNPDASLYEPKVVDLQGALTPNSDPATYEELYKKHIGDDSFADLQGFIEDDLYQDWLDDERSGESRASRSQMAIHVDGYLRYLETMALLQANDHVTNNFYLSYQTVKGMDAWEFYPVDMDLTFGCMWDSANGNPICDSFSYDGWWLNGIYVSLDGEDWHGETFELGSTDYWGNLATHEILTQTDLSLRYEDELCEVVDSPFWADRVPDLAAALGDYITDAVERDDNDMSTSLDEYFVATQEIPTFVLGRRSYLVENLGCP